MNQMTNTLSYTVRLNERYNQIDDVITNTPLWLLITEAMCDRYDDTELSQLGQGQSSKLNMIERRVLDNYSELVSVMKGVNQRVDDNNTERPFYVTNPENVATLRSYIQTLEFW